MLPNEYQKLAARTMPKSPEVTPSETEMMLLWNAVGLAGEVGEVVEHVKKGVFHRHDIDRSVLLKEIGDVLWYAAGMCTVMGIDLEQVMQENIRKLANRYPEGFASVASKERAEYSKDGPDCDGTSYPSGHE